MGEVADDAGLLPRLSSNLTILMQENAMPEAAVLCWALAKYNNIPADDANAKLSVHNFALMGGSKNAVGKDILNDFPPQARSGEVTNFLSELAKAHPPLLAAINTPEEEATHQRALRTLWEMSNHALAHGVPAAPAAAPITDRLLAPFTAIVNKLSEPSKDEDLPSSTLAEKQASHKTKYQENVSKTLLATTTTLGHMKKHIEHTGGGFPDRNANKRLGLPYMHAMEARLGTNHLVTEVVPLPLPLLPLARSGPALPIPF
jgi:hypothetical protein